MTTSKGPYAVPLAELEDRVHVSHAEQIEEQAVDRPRSYVDPEDLDRLRLLADPASVGTLHPRR